MVLKYWNLEQNSSDKNFSFPLVDTMCSLNGTSGCFAGMFLAIPEALVHASIYGCRGFQGRSVAALGSTAQPNPGGPACILSNDLMGFGSGPTHFLISSNTLLNSEFNSTFLMARLFII